MVVQRKGEVRTGGSRSVGGLDRSAAQRKGNVTTSQSIEAISREGPFPGSFATPTEGLSPLQAHVELALNPAGGARNALLEIDLAGLRGAGYEIPEISRFTGSYGMAGGGYEMQFPYAVPPELEAFWQRVTQEGDRAKNSQLALDALERTYQTLSDRERQLADGVFTDWILGSDTRRQFAGLAMIDRFSIGTALPALRTLASCLENATTVTAPYDWAKVNRIIGKVTSIRGGAGE
jgi:hypothetical protein